MSKPQRKPLISLCMIVKNEADNLARCLTSVRGAADELIIVDTGSTDDTIAIARSFGAAVISFPWTGDFAAARNAGLEKARGTWILVLDADEELDAESKGELLLCAEHVEYEAFLYGFIIIKGLSMPLRSLPSIRFCVCSAAARNTGSRERFMSRLLLQLSKLLRMQPCTLVR